MVIQLSSIRSTIKDYAQLNRFSIEGLIVEGNSLSNVNLRVISSSLPKASSVDPLEINIAGIRFIEPASVNRTGSLTLTFVESTSMDVSRFISNWVELICAGNTYEQADQVFAEGLTIIRYGRSWGERIAEYLLIKPFLSDYEMGEMSGDSTEVQRPSITLTYSDFKESF